MLNRSIDRDFDIWYYSRTFREGIEELKQDLRVLCDVGYDPGHLIAELEKECIQMKKEFSPGWW